MYRQEIAALTRESGYLTPILKERRKIYTGTINRRVKHLQREHKLVKAGQYVGIWKTIRAAIGTVTVILLSTDIGMAIGTAFGLAAGSYPDRKAKWEGRGI